MNNLDALQAGVASVTITPPKGVAMQGYGVRQAEGVADPLLANALAVGRKHIEWLLLTVDCIGLDRTFTCRVRQGLANQLALSPSAITIACSHTHSGPATLPRLGPVNADRNYLGFLEEQLNSVGRAAADNVQPAFWRFGVTSLAENVNRRLAKGGRIVLAANNKGPVDDRLRIIRIDHASGRHRHVPMALIVHYACHPTTSASIPEVSADWPGVMRKGLQDVYGDKEVLPVVYFLQGCTGDVTHRIGRDEQAWPEHFGEETAVQTRIMGRLAAAAAIVASERSSALASEEVQTVIETLDLPFSDGSGSEKSEIQIIKIGPGSESGDSVWLIGLPGEPFAHYSLELSRQMNRSVGAKPDHVVTCGYTNDCVGYFCTPNAEVEGGYEAAMAHRVYHRQSAFSDATEKIVLRACVEGGRKLSKGTQGAVRSVLKRIPRLFARSSASTS